MKRFTTYTDESGISTEKGFTVVTVIVSNEDREKFENLLEKIEKTSEKNRKWADSGNTKRIAYTKLLLKNNTFKLCSVYYSIFNNKEDYVPLVSSQIAKSIINYSDNDQYNSTIFIDKINKKTTIEIQKSIKLYKVRFKKIRALDDTNNVGLKFADAICGLIRDMRNKNIPTSFKIIYKKLKLLS